ncbi:hypothetical protein CLOSTMETH_01117 [[Clostridium] methylpentosum DSM 5476]|uniref:Uncharacterized protein n=1 Tax=[Clostridium] methylpentosum DSM 5476 TaxID=537013 RepID=C0EB99_9FIRM|nr:hypothetical protein CLOSTMETH_01117 [[Clostridium] methylpentosum DSM 5476]
MEVIATRKRRFYKRFLPVQNIFHQPILRQLFQISIGILIQK